MDDPGLPTRLAEALAAATIEVVYQPIVRLSDGRTVAVEALARWTDRERGRCRRRRSSAAAERPG